MGSEEQQSTDLHENGKEWEFPSDKELGALLRARREKRGLTYAEISKQIMIRESYLEALENEDWDRLPSPTFIKGFIRSYAQVLGLSGESLIALYEETAPRSQQMTKSIVAAPKKKRGLLYLVLVFSVLAGVVAYEWITPPAFRENQTELSPVLPAENGSQSPETDTGRRLEKSEAPPDESPHPAGLMATGRKIVQEESVPLSGPEETVYMDTLAKAPERTDDRESSGTLKPAEAETPIPDTETAPASESEGDAPPLVLKVNVKERTWVRVTIDGNPSKEYILNTESRPEWKAHEKFELLIGNAGGIDLEYNGKKLEDLGKRGQVIRLRLPYSDEGNVPGD